jgi:hypothetical protein
MNLSFTRRVFLVIALGIAGLFCPLAHAESLDGTIDLGGTVKFDKKSLGKATSAESWKNPSVTNVSGDLASLVHPGDSATLSVPWNFKGSTPPGAWTMGGLHLDLMSWDVVSQATKSLNVTGTGMLGGGGMDPTPVTFDFSSSKQNGATHSTFALQTSQDAAVPEPSTLLLIVAGCATLVGVQKRFRGR